MLWILWYMWRIPFAPLYVLLELGEVMEVHPNEDIQIIGGCLVRGVDELVYYMAIAREEIFMFFGGYIPKKEMVCRNTNH